MVFTSFDGKQIFVREWTDVERPCGVVQIAHGMEEHAGRYDRFARELNALGYAVVADDHRGHGDTDPDTLGYAPGDMFADTVEDMAGIAQRYRAKFAGVPYVLFGFSYGSFLTQAFIERHAGLLDGAIIAGSSKQKGGMVALGAAVAAIGCAFKGASAPAKLIDRLVFGGYDKKFDDREFLSTDAENNERYYADPFCGFKCSYNFYRSFFRGLKGLYTKESAAGLDRELPLLLIAGAEDAVGGAEGVGRLYDFYKKQGVKRVEKHLIEGSRHEFLNEREHRDEGVSQIAAFLRGVAVRRGQES